MEVECRTCLKVSTRMVDVFSDDLPFKIQEISSVEISSDERLPSSICDECTRSVKLFYDFREIIKKTDMVLRERLCKRENEEALDVHYDEIEFKTEEFEEDNFEFEIEEDVKTEDEVMVDDTKEEEVKYKCDRCDFTCSLYNLWRNHKNTHKEVAKSMCNICGKSVTSTNLRQHILVHTEPPVACEICGKLVKNTESLRAHMYIHKGGPLQCITCGKVYKHRQGFYAHRRRHKLGDVKTIECDVCGKMFYDKQTLTKHIRSHTGERPYPCPFCNKGFSSLYARKTHIRRHTLEKPFTCEFCDAAFPQRVSLRTHMKSRHSDKILQQNT